MQVPCMDDLVESVGDETCCCHAKKPPAQCPRLPGEGAERRRGGADLGCIAGPAGDKDCPSKQREDNRTGRHAEPAEAARPRASLASHPFYVEITLQPVVIAA